MSMVFEPPDACLTPSMLQAHNKKFDMLTAHFKASPLWKRRWFYILRWHIAE
jgi:hypothetical protein